MTVKQQFAAMLRTARTEHRMTWAEVAEATGISEPTLKAYASGTVCPPLDRALIIAKFFKLDIDTIN